LQASVRQLFLYMGSSANADCWTGLTASTKLPLSVPQCKRCLMLACVRRVEGARAHRRLSGGASLRVWPAAARFVKGVVGG